MGLDTVELIWAFERYFTIDFTDAVAEQTHTVSDVAAYVAQRLEVAGQRESAARAAVAKQLRRLLPSATEETPLHELLPTRQAVKALRLALQPHCNVELRQLAAPPGASPPPSLWERLRGRPLDTTAPHWSIQPLAALINWVVAAGYATLLVPSLASRYEIERAVVGITSDKSGVPVEEILLSSSFTNDLGMD